MKKPHVVIIGSGISGLSACWHLKDYAKVTLIEKGEYLGGHTHTHTLKVKDKNIQLDSGFIVFNDRTYPGLRDWFSQLNVETHAADMSFSVSLINKNFEWAGSSLGTVFAQRRRLYDFEFLKMLRDIIRFNRNAPKHAANEGDEWSNKNLGDYLDKYGYSTYFQHRYLLPMAGAIWSCPTSEIRNFPLKFFISFCQNHGLLSIFNRPQWFSVKGGSRRYIDALVSDTKNRDVTFHLRSEAVAVNKTEKGLDVITQNQNGDRGRLSCDEVIMACHSDEAAKIIKNISERLHNELSKIRFEANRVVIHSDESLMPKTKRAWSSWNYLSKAEDNKNNHVAVTYFMNKLQFLPTKQNLFVTLNPINDPSPSKTYKTVSYCHPVMNQNLEICVKKIQQCQGQHNVWIAGAWLGNGFHESGFQSGKWAAQSITKKL